MRGEANSTDCPSHWITQETLLLGLRSTSAFAKVNIFAFVASYTWRSFAESNAASSARRVLEKILPAMREFKSLKRTAPHLKEAQSLRNSASHNSTLPALSITF